METRRAGSRALGLVVLFMVLLGSASCCGSVEARTGALGGLDFCMNDLFRFGAASSALDIFSTESPFGASSHDQKFGSSASKPSAPNHEVRSSPGKGLGLFATALIPQGSSILIEEPLVSVSMPEMVEGRGFRITDMVPDIESGFRLLSPSQQEEFMSLHDFRFPSETEQSHLLTIFRSNAYNTGDDRIGLFPKTARINHSCRPNSGNWWSGNMQRRVIYAMRDIEEGEEITVSYIPLLKSTKERQTRLAQYGFECDCVACAQESREGDKRRVMIGEWLEDLEGKMGRKSKKSEVNKKRIEKAKKLAEMMEAEGLGDYVSRGYHLLAVFNQHLGNLADAETWARKEKEVLGWAEKDSDESLASAEFVKSLKNS